MLLPGERILSYTYVLPPPIRDGAIIFDTDHFLK